MFLALIIAGLNVVGDVCLFIAGLILLIFVCAYNCDDLSKAMAEEGEAVLDADQSFLCDFGRGSNLKRYSF